MNMQNPELSVVIPCYNEEENVEAIAAAVIRQVEPLTNSFDLIFIDNDSTDRTVELIKALCSEDQRIRLIVNTRNFGQMRSPTHAVYAARGNAVVGLCADFQDPPEMIPEFVRRWRAGAHIVLGVRKYEKAGFFLTQMRRLSYWLAKRFGDYPLIPNATGFGLYDAKVIRATRKLAEPEPFFRGMLLETGYSVETIAFNRPERASGQSKNTFFALLDFAMSTLAGSSKRLLRLPIYVGVFGAFMSIIMLLGGIIAFLIGRPIAGWFIAAVVQAEFALLFGLLGLLGENLRIVSERTRRTPLVLERERVNFPADY